MRCSTAKITAINIVYIIILSFIFIIACTEKAIVGEAAKQENILQRNFDQDAILSSGKNWTAIIQVRDGSGRPVVSAYVALQERISGRNYVLKTSSKGTAEFKNIDPDMHYLLKVSKAAYLSKTVPFYKENYEVNYLPRVQRMELEITLLPIKKSEPKLILPATTPGEGVLPGEAGMISTVILEAPHERIFRTPAQELRFVHYPVPNQTILPDLESIDAVLFIVPKKNAVFPKQNLLLGYQEFKQKNIKPYSPSLFKFKVGSEGVYNWRLSYVLHFKNGTSLSYPTYPPIKAVESDVVTIGFEYFFLILPPQPEPQYQEVIPNHNDKDDPNRINLFFVHGDGSAIWEDVWQNESQIYGAFLQEMLKGKFGIFNVEPFKSNTNKFNFWYANEIITVDYTTGSYDIVYGEKTPDSLSAYQKYRLGIALPNLIVVRVDADTASHIGGKTCYPTDSIILYAPIQDMVGCHEKMGASWEQCAGYFPLSFILSHELGHQLAYLPEEYGVAQYDANYFFDPLVFNTYNKYFEYNLGPGGDTTFYTGLIDKENDCKKEYYITCTPDAEAVSYCEENARWKDLIGNGCGQEGIVDCPEDRSEVSCTYAGAGWPKVYLSADITKSTKVSIMESDLKFLNIALYKAILEDGEVKYILTYPNFPFKGLISFRYGLDNYNSYNGRFFGQVNERQLCRHIKLYTGSAEGICNTLCMEGCSNGQKCLNGTCQTG